MKNYRPLSSQEIEQLENQGCMCCNWSLVKVSEDFSPDTIIETFFTGNIRLGKFDHEFVLPNGISNPAGIYKSRLHNCVVGDNVYIAHVNNYIANYDIGENAYIENIGSLSVDGETAFGNGTQVAVLDETGSRALPVYSGLSAQIAYLLTWYRHEKEAIAQMENIISEETKKATSTTGKIGQGATILNCRVIKNVNMGDFAKLEGVSLLETGTVNSSQKAQTTVGPNVIARDFIIETGTQVTDGVQLERCFVGQGCLLSKQFSAIDSLFFANSQGFHGEAVSVFAAPYTVTHHKSTLLIGGMFSFFNAGSGSNESNHAYKLGPIHYGVVSRGSKMASDSYLPLPSRIGVFSVLIGKHKNKMDVSDFPFSYLAADGRETTIIPAINLQSIGTFRDAAKWKTRDMRKENPTDIISFDMLNPYTIQQIVKGWEKLKSNFIFPDKKVKIKESAIVRGIELYEMAMMLYIGNILKDKLSDEKPLKTSEIPYTEWIDCAGFVIPQEKISDILSSLKNKKINSTAEIQSAFESIYSEYENLELNYIFYLCEKILGGNIAVATLLEKYGEAKKKLLKLLVTDAGKEFNDIAKINHGLDQTPEIKEKEFEILRGKMDDNAFIKQLMEE